MRYMLATALVLAIALPAKAQDTDENQASEGAPAETGFIAGINESLSGVDAAVAEWVVGPLGDGLFLRRHLLGHLR